MRFIFILMYVATLCVTGCAPNARVQRQSDFWLPSASIQVKIPDKISYWPIYGKDLKNIISQGIVRELRMASITVVDDNADIILLIKNIETGGWSGHVLVTKIEVAALEDEDELFKITYEQNPALFGEFYKFWGALRGPEQIAKILGKRIARELKRKDKM